MSGLVREGGCLQRQARIREVIHHEARARRFFIQWVGELLFVFDRKDFHRGSRLDLALYNSNIARG